MRAVILLNPRIQAEQARGGNDYSEASLGFDYHGAIDDHVALAKHLRELADVLEAPIVPNTERL